MFQPIKHKEIFIDYKDDKDLFYKEIYTNHIADFAFVKLYHKEKYICDAYVWCDNEENGREYIEINHTVVYLDTLATLVSVEDVITHVCKTYNTTLAILQTPSRRKEHREPRSILFYILREIYGIPFQEIATMFHRISHVTVMSGVKKINGYITIESRYSKYIKSLILTTTNQPNDEEKVLYIME